MWDVSMLLRLPNIGVGAISELADLGLVQDVKRMPLTWEKLRRTNNRLLGTLETVRGLLEAGEVGEALSLLQTVLEKES